MKHIFAGVFGLLVGIGAHAEPLAVVDGNGVVIGSYVGPAGPVSDDNDPAGARSGAAIIVASPTGYLFTIGQATGKVLTVGAAPGMLPHTDNQPGTEIRGYPYFTTTNCTGQAYAPVNTSGSGVPSSTPNVRGGVVVGLYLPSTALYYAPKTTAALVMNFAAGSALFQGACNPFSGTAAVIPIQPNDPQVTGVGTSQFVPPITLSAVPVIRTLFKDGFENPQASNVEAFVVEFSV